MLTFSTFRHALARLGFIFTFTLLLFMMSSCSRRNESWTPITESGLHRYVFKALNTNFEFDFEVIEYKVFDREGEKYVEEWKIAVSDEVLNSIADTIEESDSRECQVTGGYPGEGAVPLGTERIPAYVCRVKLYNEPLSLFARFESDSNIVTVSVRHLILTGVF